VIALDPRGHGESDKPERGYNYHTLAKDLDGFLRALDLNDATCRRDRMMSALGTKQTS